MDSSGKFYYLKKITQILVSVSVFSLLYSQSSLVPRLVEFYDYIFSNSSIKLFTYKTERNYIFLLCNGILMLIIQTSGLISKITAVQSNRITDHHAVKSVDQDQMMKPKIVEIRKRVEVFEEEKVVRDDIHDREAEDENIISVDVKEDNYQIEDWEKDEEDEEGIDHELNKKCEDFIRKMKRELMSS